MENNIGDYRLLASVEETNILPIDEIGSNVNTFLLGAEKNYAYDKKGNLREVKGNKGVDYSSLFEMEERANTLFNHPDNNRVVSTHYESVVTPQRYTSGMRNLAKENRMQAREARIQNRYSSSQIQTKPKEERIGYINKPVSSNKTSYLNFSNSLNNQNEIVMKPKKKEKNYEEIANVFYPDMPEVSQIKARAKKEMYEIEKERWTEHAKNFAGAGLEIGSSLIPAVKGVKIANTVAKAIAPKVGKKISQEIASGLVSGGIAGGVFGLGEGLLQDENPIITALEGLAIGSATGALGNWGLGLLDKLNISKEILANPNNKALLKQYYDDYVDGLENISEALAEYRRLLMGGKKVASEKINDSLDEFDIEKIMNLVEKLKKTKPIDPVLKKEGEIIIMKESLPFEKGEMDYAISKIVSDMSKNDIQNGYAIKRLSYKYKKDYMYDLKFDIDGKHSIGKYEVNDSKYD